jgi:hypothetical protein
MFIGHFAVALAAKRSAPSVSLGMLFLSCQLADLVWPTFLLLGVERVAIDPGNTVVTPLNFISYPYSHSLVALGVWALAAALAYRTLRGRAAGGAAVVIALVVLSHWVLDVASHRPDVPITIGGTTRLGLGLWNHRAATMLVEMAMLVGGVVIYRRATAGDRVRPIGFWTLIAFLLVINVTNMFGPPPPSVTAIAWTCEALWIVVVWGYWVDKGSMARSPDA